MTMQHSDLVALDKRANDWMHRGIDLLNGNTPDGLKEAVECFDQAIALRSTLPLTENSRHGYALAGGWMNRGDALARLGEERLEESIKAYDEALGHLLKLPLDEDALYPRRLAIAWINRGFALQKHETGVARTEALQCFRQALAVLGDSSAAGIADLCLLKAGALTNLAGALLDVSEYDAAEARKLAQGALSLIHNTEHDDVTAAETSFKARYVLCRAITAESHDDQTIPSELAETAIDAVDEGLALARRWRQRGENRFGSLAEDLFRFGCRIYQTGQPRFLAEFILESLDPQKSNGALPLHREMHEAAVAALWNALKDIQRDGFQSLSTPRFEQVLANLRELRVTEDRLEQLRRAAPA